MRNTGCSRCPEGSTSLHVSPPDGRSTRYDRQDFVALACRAQRTVQVRLRAPSGSRLVLTALSRTLSRHVVRNAGQKGSSATNPDRRHRAVLSPLRPRFRRCRRSGRIFRFSYRPFFNRARPSTLPIAGGFSRRPRPNRRPPGREATSARSGRGRGGPPGLRIRSCRACREAHRPVR